MIKFEIQLRVAWEGGAAPNFGSQRYWVREGDMTSQTYKGMGHTYQI